jgi:hypothetical protein
MSKALENKITLDEVRTLPPSDVATKTYIAAQGYADAATLTGYVSKASLTPAGVVVSNGSGTVSTSTTLNLGETIISSGGANPALRVTYTGTGEAVRIEDAANPDSSPIVVDLDGKLIVGGATSALAAGLQVHGTGPFSQLGIFRSSADTGGSSIQLSKTRGTSPTDFTAVASGDTLGALIWRGTKGDAFASVSAITCLVDGTPSTSSLPSKLTFTTTPTGATVGSERLVIDNQGDVTINQSLKVEASTAIPAGGTTGTGLLLSATANFGIFFGSGVPTLSAARGSLYLRTDGFGVDSRLYVNTNGTTGWTAVSTVG